MRRRLLVRYALAVVCAAALVAAAPGTAYATPDDNPCDLVAEVLCKFIPMAPELEGDIDLTRQQPPEDPNAPSPDTRRPADICANGCM